eukprot:11322853-Alexandrium_andersonii.AAC.1
MAGWRFIATPRGESRRGGLAILVSADALWLAAPASFMCEGGQALSARVEGLHRDLSITVVYSFPGPSDARPWAALADQ